MRVFAFPEVRHGRRAVTILALFVAVLVVALGACELLALASINVPNVHLGREAACATPPIVLNATCRLAVIVAEHPVRLRRLIKELVFMGVKEAGVHEDLDGTMVRAQLFLPRFDPLTNSLQANLRSVKLYTPEEYDHVLLGVCSSSIVITVHERCLEKTVYWAHNMHHLNLDSSYFIGLL